MSTEIMDKDVDTEEFTDDPMEDSAESNAALSAIANLGKPEPEKTFNDTSSTSAPAEGNRPNPFDYEEGKVAPTDGQPEGEAGTGDATTQVGTDQSSNQAKTDGTVSATGEPAEEDDEDLLDMLGLQKPEPETIETFKKRYEESSREGHRLSEERALIEQMLTAKGVELVKTANGYDFRPREDYVKQITDADLPDLKGLMNELPVDVREELVELGSGADRLVSAIAKEASKKAMVKLLADRPAVTSEAPQNIITTEEADKCLEDMVSAKLRDGVTPRFPEADKPEVQKLMNMVFNSPAKAELKLWMLSKPDRFYNGLELIYTEVGLARVKRVLAKKDADRQRQEVTNKNKSDASVTDGVQNVEPKNAKTGATMSREDQLLADISAAKAR